MWYVLSYLAGLITIPALLSLWWLLPAVYRRLKLMLLPFWYKGLWCHCAECGKFAFVYRCKVIFARIENVEDKRNWPLFCRKCHVAVLAKVKQEQDRAKEERRERLESFCKENSIPFS